MVRPPIGMVYTESVYPGDKSLRDLFSHCFRQPPSIHFQILTADVPTLI